MGPISMVSRPFTPVQRSQCGRSPARRIWRAKLTYEEEYPRATTSSNNAVAHRCGSSTNRAAT